MSHDRSLAARLRRRAVSVPSLVLGSLVLTICLPLWLPIAVIADLARAKPRLPITRLLAFAVCWCWIETTGVMWTFGLWLVGRARSEPLHYRLMGWWAGALVSSMRLVMGIDPRVEGLEQLEGGNAVVLCRHVSLADSLLSGWATCTRAGLSPRYVLKRELLFDPCLDIVGLRIPNHFLDRTAVDGAGELDALRTLANGVGPGVCAVIFPEGTRANDAKRERAIEKIGARDPARAERMRQLRYLLPPRPAGSGALLDGAPDADVVLAWHTGFDGLDTFGGMIRVLSRPLPPVRFVARRIPRAEVPAGDGFGPWLDEQWTRMDAEVASALSQQA